MRDAEERERREGRACGALGGRHGWETNQGRIGALGLWPVSFISQRSAYCACVAHHVYVHTSSPATPSARLVLHNLRLVQHGPKHIAYLGMQTLCGVSAGRAGNRWMEHSLARLTAWMYSSFACFISSSSICRRSTCRDMRSCAAIGEVGRAKHALVFPPDRARAGSV